MTRQRKPRREIHPMTALEYEALPDLCFVDNRWNKSPGAPRIVVVKKGESGYYPCAIQTSLTADDLNEACGVTRAQAMAMHAGSMFGWHIPGANALNYERSELQAPTAFFPGTTRSTVNRESSDATSTR